MKTIERRFEIRRDEKIITLIKKYDEYTQNYIPSDEEANLPGVVAKLNEWEKVVWYALTECRSIRKFASYFGISERAAHLTILDIKERVKSLLKNS